MNAVCFSFGTRDVEVDLRVLGQGHGRGEVQEQACDQDSAHRSIPRGPGFSRLTVATLRPAS